MGDLLLANAWGKSGASQLRERIAGELAASYDGATDAYVYTRDGVTKRLVIRKAHGRIWGVFVTTMEG